MCVAFVKYFSLLFKKGIQNKWSKRHQIFHECKTQHHTDSVLPSKKKILKPHVLTQNIGKKVKKNSYRPHCARSLNQYDPINLFRNNKNLKKTFRRDTTINASRSFIQNWYRLITILLVLIVIIQNIENELTDHLKKPRRTIKNIYLNKQEM